MRGKILPLDALVKVLQRARKRGKKIVLTNGCFDLLHVGHIKTLRAAKKRGDILVVALNSDASVRKLKGHGRPLITQNDRAELLASLECVDYVTIFGGLRPFPVIKKIRPNVHVKGGDYKPTDLPEKQLVESLGGKVVVAPHIPHQSTTKLMRRIQQLILIISIALPIVFGTTSHTLAWKITPELEKEIAQKEKVVKQSPYHPHAHFDLAVTYGYSNKILEGWDELKVVNELDPKYAPIALRKYDRLVKRHPKDRKLKYRLAFALYFNDQKREAFAQFKQLTEEDPKDIWPLGYMATIMGEQGNYAESIILIQRGLEIDSDVAAFHLLLATAYFNTGERWKGVKESAEVIRLKALGY